ncbi:2-methylthioadenine synthetase [Photobacterium phosphoreum]|uniref:2-methylthioadenine synthetase n=1 Tax=Photobacterium phosphoreum TaxID=659 RepID=A0A2T3JTN3_PHOPO|nr:SAVED domain-containing protein [Photobacterium phosphoreum]PSU21262.1 2-methylthioadenine synthetase [Photobacterium phosphoreum]PSU40226.1 2-methylthioadenine synthetase [Photobacterium phosphoreum]PSU52479.1 2-methylthioadenine synthetase [Photobacterium phosphoreum]
MTFFKDLMYRLLHWGDLLFKWYTRPKSKLFTIGKFLVVSGLSSIGLTTALKIAFITPEGYELTASFFENDTGIFILLISSCFIIVGFFLIIYDALLTIKDSGKANNILVEHIALFKPLSSSFLSTVTKAKGKMRCVKIDLSEYYRDGVLSEPSDAVNDTRVMLKNAVASLSDAIGNESASIHYGGTPPVCLGFYSGFFIGNTTSVMLWDYDRDLEEWHCLDRSFDSNQPIIDESEYKQDLDEVCLIFSISFNIEKVARETTNTSSIITIKMPHIGHDNMSSLSKLLKFKKEFRALLNKFTQDGIKRIHIFCAAQSSFNFTMGQQITRNHPECIVYEFVNREVHPYPWGLKFNNKDCSPPIVIENKK